MIRTKNLYRTFQFESVQIQALRGVSLEVETGDFVAIMGSSGGGKSTLLRLLGILDNPTSGEVLINNTKINRMTDTEQTMFRLERLGYVFQDYSLLPELTALDNVILPAMTLNSTKDYVNKGKELLRLVGLENRERHLPADLSGGEQQRVTVARSLINDPLLILADEPCANLDSVNSKNILELFQKLNREMNMTIVMVTHDEWHKNYVNRIYTLEDGVLAGVSDNEDKLAKSIDDANKCADQLDISSAESKYYEIKEKFQNKKQVTEEEKKGFMELEYKLNILNSLRKYNAGQADPKQMMADIFRFKDYVDLNTPLGDYLYKWFLYLEWKLKEQGGK